MTETIDLAAAEPLVQSEVSQAEILVLLDWLDKLVQVAERTGRETLAAALDSSYSCIERTFRSPAPSK